MSRRETFVPEGNDTPPLRPGTAAPAPQSGPGIARQRRHIAGGRTNKVAEITLAFWILKILATTLGETTGDFFSMTLGLGYFASLGITFGLLAAVLAVQVGLRTFHASIFWLAIIGTTTFGTELSDLLDRPLGLGYIGGAALLLGGLLATMAAWHRRERDLSVYPIVRVDTEIMFWVAVIFSNSLGTAFGDFLSDSAGLGYLTGAYITAGVIAVVLLLHYATSLNGVLLFWLAFIFTRPFGATFGDLLTKPSSHGGMALPRSAASGAALGLMVIVLAMSYWWASRQGRPTEPEIRSA